MSTVLFKRGSTSDMNDTNIQDGLLFFNTETYKIYMDNGTERIQYGGDTDLISSAEDASLTNAFNAESSLGLFSQKATVVDSKANALSVTQNYIPLGCLAFKEALGTTNYSTVGNGTISGALVSLNTSVSNLNTSVSNLSNSVSSINGSIGELNNRTNVRGTVFYFDCQGGKWGWNSSSARGAGSFHPFSVDTLPDGEFYACAICAEPSDGRVSIPVHIFQKYHYFRIHVEGTNKSLAYYADNGNAFEVPSTPRNLDTWYGMNTSNYLNVKWFGGGNGYAIFYVILGL